MALLGDDGRGYELARKLESCNVWRKWLGESTYANFASFLNSPSTWEAFMDSKSRAHLHLQLRVRALLFDKACVSLFLRPHSNSSSSSSSSSSSLAVSKLNSDYLQLHPDDVYFTLENSSQDGVQVQHRDPSMSSKIQSKAASGVGSRYGESEIDNKPSRFKNDELLETWYNQFMERYRISKPYRLSSADRESEKRTPEEMSAYLKLLERHKKKRLAFKEDQYMGYGNPILENVSHMNPNSVLDGSNSVDSEIYFFPETMFTFNCVPDSALPPLNREEDNQKVECYGVLDMLPQIMTRSPVMLERLGIRPEYLSMEQGGILHRGKNGSGGNKKCLSKEQATQLSQTVIARMLTSIGFESATEVPIDVFSQMLSCHISKLGGSLKVLTDSYRKQCSAIELLKMFLQTIGYSNFGPLMEQVKDGSRNFQQTQQQIHGIQSQLQSQHQNPIRLQQMSRQMLPQMQQVALSKNVPFQQQQQLERMRRRQPSTPRAVMDMDKDRPMVQVKIEAPSELPMDGNALYSFKNPSMQFRQQHTPAMSNLTMPNVHPQSGNQFRQMASLQIPQMQAQNAGVLRAPPVKVEGFQELMGGDASSKHDSDENRLTSPLSK
ncbi:hypothetical protein CerSpe_218980 [Prunus speciosa]